MVMEFPFKDAPNTACLVCKHVLNKEKPILYVSHDAEDGMCDDDGYTRAELLTHLEDVKLIDKVMNFACQRYGCEMIGDEITAEHPDKMVAKEHKHNANRYDRRKAKQSLSKLVKNI